MSADSTADSIDYTLVIKESHLDTFGHVNNATYLVLFEEARWDIVTARGYGLSEVQNRMVGPTILEIKINFLKEIRNREKILIRTLLPQKLRKVTTLRQTMINERGEEVCIADFVIGLFDMRSRRLIDPTPEWTKALSI